MRKRKNGNLLNRIIACFMAAVMLLGDSSVVFAQNGGELSSGFGSVSADITELLVCGSDNVVYENVDYLTVSSVLTFDEDMLEEYSAMCDEVAQAAADGEPYDATVFYVDEDGALGMEVVVSLQRLSVFGGTFADGIADVTAGNVTDADVTDGDVTGSDVTDGDVTDGDVTGGDVTDGDVTDGDVTDGDVTDGDVTDADVTDGDVTDGNVTDGDLKQAKSRLYRELGRFTDHISITELEEILDNEEYAAYLQSLEPVTYVNLEAVESIAPEEEEVELPTPVTTTMATKNYFRSQLTSEGKNIYDASLKALGKGKNSFSYKSSVRSGIEVFCNAVSANVCEYPSQFDWMDKGNGSISYKRKYSGGKYQYNVTTTKSKHYSASLANQAQKKAAAVVDDAYAYAEKYYSNCMTYGILLYLNNWICQNNYYNYVGAPLDDPYKSYTTAQLKKIYSSKEYFYCHSSIGCLLKGYGVCESYALAMNRMLEAAGISNVYVVGKTPGGGHAWNHVQMPNGSWYLLDTTWNDSSSSNTTYFLSASDSSHSPTGKQYNSGMTFTFPTLSTSRYTAQTAENYSINDSYVAMKKGQKTTIRVTTYPFSNYKVKWTSANPKVAKVDAKGQITAVAPGKTVVTCNIAGKTKEVEVFVYQFTKLSFNSTGKNTYSYTYTNPDDAFTAADAITVTLKPEQKNADIAPALGKLMQEGNIAGPVVTVANKKIATVDQVTISGNVISMRVTPKALGTTKITVKFAGMTATMTYNSKRKVESGWFNINTGSYTYSGKANCPKVTKTTSAPKDLKFTVKYKNNTNAGTASVIVTGTGNYSGELTYSFNIAQRKFNDAEFVSCTATANYTGKAAPVKAVVKWGKTTLKQDVDYEVLYNGSTTVPVNAGTYTVSIRSKANGNYSSATLTKTMTYVIKPVAVNKLKINCASSVKLKDDAVIFPAYTVKLGNVVLQPGAKTYQVKVYNAADPNHTNLKTISAKGKYVIECTVANNTSGNIVNATAKGKADVTTITKTFTVK